MLTKVDIENYIDDKKSIKERSNKMNGTLYKNAYYLGHKERKG